MSTTTTLPQVGDTVRLLSSPNAEKVPVGAEGTVVEGNPAFGALWVEFPDHMPDADLQEQYGTTGWPLYAHEVEVIAVPVDRGPALSVGDLVRVTKSPNEKRLAVGSEGVITFINEGLLIILSMMRSPSSAGWSLQNSAPLDVDEVELVRHAGEGLAEAA